MFSIRFVIFSPNPFRADSSFHYYVPCCIQWPQRSQRAGANLRLQFAINVRRRDLNKDFGCHALRAAALPALGLRPHSPCDPSPRDDRE
jgi:hypothetical protein